ncbi:unnamed protein product [Orchesella dallaii]|uniref:Secreted protein n=1 Tax=Orchesella dallaii TaxID=48710 RepID=A0ABP1R1C7_9HEXA
MNLGILLCMAITCISLRVDASVPSNENPAFSGELVRVRRDDSVMSNLQGRKQDQQAAPSPTTPSPSPVSIKDGDDSDAGSDENAVGRQFFVTDITEKPKSYKSVWGKHRQRGKLRRGGYVKQ